MPSQPSKRPPTIREQIVAHFTRGPGRDAFEKALQTLVADPATPAPIKAAAQAQLQRQMGASGGAIGSANADLETSQRRRDARIAAEPSNSGPGR